MEKTKAVTSLTYDRCGRPHNCKRQHR